MILGLDIGTTSIAGVLVAPGGREVVQSASCCHEADVSGLPPGRHEQYPGKIVEVSREILRSLAEKSNVPVQAIALTGQMHGILAVDADLEPLTNLITWRDRRTADYPDDLRLHSYAEETGCFLHPGYGGLTLHHLLHTGAVPENTHAVLSIPGFVAAHLTGCCAVDETFAASWGIWDPTKSDWHDGLLDSLSIPRTLLPRFVRSCTELAPATNAEDLGVASGAVVYSPVGDNQAGVAGVLNDGRTEAVVNVGTSGQLSLPIDDYQFTPRAETRPRPGGGYLQVYATLCGGWAYAYLARFFQQVVEQLGRIEIPLSTVIDRMQAFCSATETDGLRVDTRFAGERVGESVTGSVSGVDTRNLTPENLARGFVNGMAAELAQAASDADLSTFDGLVAVGNAVRKSPLLLTALEQEFGMPCRLVEQPEEAALGAALSVAGLAPHLREGTQDE